MGHIICITSQKGGVGKTTTAINLSSGFAVAEKKTLLVDCDPLGHATIGMGIDKTSLQNTLYHAMVGKNFAQELIIKSELAFLNMLPARIELCRAEVELMSEKDKEFLLRNLLMGLKDEYDYIIIDSPPSLNLLTTNAINAADFLLVPLQCEFYALEGLCYQLKIIKALKEQMNPDIRIAGILLTMFEKKTKISRQIVEDVRKHFKDMVFQTVIPRNEHLRNSSSSGKPSFLSDIMSVGAQSYLELAKEFILRWPAR